MAMALVSTTAAVAASRAPLASVERKVIEAFPLEATVGPGLMLHACSIVRLDDVRPSLNTA
jgi:hypothetical protein